MQEKNEVWKPGRRNTASRAWEPEPGCVAGYRSRSLGLQHELLLVRRERDLSDGSTGSLLCLSKRNPGATSTRDTRRGALQNEGARSALPNATGAIGTGRVREAIGFAGFCLRSALTCFLDQSRLPARMLSKDRFVHKAPIRFNDLCIFGG
jgi:hypothetical protein